jgi:vacuolar-type H+-ATPase subunit I/STV1
VAIDDEHKKPIAMGSTEKAVDDNAKRAIDLYLGEAKNSRGEIINNKEYSMDPKELAALVKNAVDEAIAAKNGEDRMDAMEATLAKHGDALNEINEKLSPKKEEAENADGEAKKEEEEKAATLENAKPSQEMVKAFSTAMNVDFGANTPTFDTLAALAGIKENDPAARIVAVNTKFAEMQKNAPKENQTAAAQNAAVGEVF